jgi:hypothetical protein
MNRSRQPPGGRPLLAGTVAYAHIDQWLRRIADGSQRAVGAMLRRAMTPREQVEIGIHLYDVAFSLRPEPLDPFDWEPGWFAARLPLPPAKLFVGAAGAGREAVYLQGRGYDVTLLEPARKRAERCRGRVGPQAVIAIATYEDLADSVLDGASTPASPIAGECFDAVLLGWGSLSHIVHERDRQRLLRALDRLCPNGPILSSFWLGSKAPGAGKAERLGGWIGGLIGAARGVPAPADPEPEIFASGYGFAHSYSRAEIAQLAAAADREVSWDHADGEQPRATFLPRRSGAPPC